MTLQWEGFEPGLWQKEINVHDFIQQNYAPYEGDESFLAPATERTKRIWNRLKDLFVEERLQGNTFKRLVPDGSSRPGFRSGQSTERLPGRRPARELAHARNGPETGSACDSRLKGISGDGRQARIADAVVPREDSGFRNSRRSDDDAVCGVSMESIGKRRHLGSHRGRDRQPANERWGGRALEPISQRQIELDPSEIVERSHLPERDVGDQGLSSLAALMISRWALRRGIEPAIQ